MPRLPILTARQLIRFLKDQGFVEVRQSGSHLTLRRESDGRTVTVPVHTGQRTLDEDCCAVSCATPASPPRTFSVSAKPT